MICERKDELQRELGRREVRVKEIEDVLNEALVIAGLEDLDLSDKEFLIIGPGEYCPERQVFLAMGAQEELITEVDSKKVEEIIFAGKNFYGGTDYRYFLAKEGRERRFDLIIQIKAGAFSEGSLRLIYQRLTEGGIFIWQHMYFNSNEIHLPLRVIREKALKKWEVAFGEGNFYYSTLEGREIMVGVKSSLEPSSPTASNSS